MDICVITDFDGNLQGVVPIPTTTDKTISLFKVEQDVKAFEKVLIEYVQEYYWDETEILSVEISPRFWKYEQTEAKFIAEDDFFHLNLQLTGIDTPIADKFVLQDEGYVIAVVEAGSLDELYAKVHKALEEEYDPDFGDRELTLPADYNWGESGEGEYKYVLEGDEMIQEFSITKIVSY